MQPTTPSKVPSAILFTGLLLTITYPLRPAKTTRHIPKYHSRNTLNQLITSSLPSSLPATAGTSTTGTLPPDVGRLTRRRGDGWRRTS